MVNLTPVVSEFKKKVLEEFGNAVFILFGSQVRGDAEEESDIDVLVILDREVNTLVREKIYDIAYEIELKYDIVLDVSVFSKFEWDRYRKVLPFAIRVEKEGIVV